MSWLNTVAGNEKVELKLRYANLPELMADAVRCGYSITKDSSASCVYLQASPENSDCDRSFSRTKDGHYVVF